MKECLFCKIINRELKAEIIFENSKIISFKDVNPQAPFHALVVPKKHIQTLNHITEDYVNLLESSFSLPVKLRPMKDTVMKVIEQYLTATRWEAKQFTIYICIYSQAENWFGHRDNHL